MVKNWSLLYVWVGKADVSGKVGVESVVEEGVVESVVSAVGVVE